MLVDGEFYYEEAGDGPPVVLLHAGLLDARMWDEQFALLSAAGYRTIRYDARGHGRSGTPTAAFGHHEDLRSILDALGVDTATLVGLSLGARTSLDFTLTYPDRAAGLFLAGPGMSGMTISDPFILAEGAKSAAAFKAGDLPGFVEAFLRQWVDGPRREPSDMDPVIREHCRQMAAQTADRHRRGDAEWFEAGAADRLRELRVPLVALLGDLDSTDIARVVDALAATVPGARKVLVPGAGHMVNLEQPAVFNRELLAFLSR